MVTRLVLANTPSARATATSRDARVRARAPSWHRHSPPPPAPSKAASPTRVNTLTEGKGTMQPITRFSSKLIAIPNENVDTDQIIPARFLKVTDKSGLGEALFTDWRARDPNFVLNQPRAKDAH